MSMCLSITCPYYLYCFCRSMPFNLCNKHGNYTQCLLLHHTAWLHVEVVEAWLRKIPSIYSGVTAAVRCFDRDQRAGLQAILSNKLLLEIDAPYFPLGNAHVSTRAYLGEVAAFVAVPLNVRPAELMQATLDNACKLYG